MLRGRVDAPFEGWVTMRSERGEYLLMPYSEGFPEDVVRVWALEWRFAYANCIKFEAPDGSKSKWLNHTTDALPDYPFATRLIANDCILLALQQELLAHAAE